MPSEWLDDALNVPCLRLRLRYVATSAVRTPSFPGYAIMGALKGRLGAIADDASQPADLRHYAHVVHGWHGERASAPGLSERPSVLVTDAPPLALHPGDELTIGLTLFGEAAEVAARTYAAAGTELELNHGLLQLVAATPGTPAALGAASLGDAERLAAPGSRLRLETPAILESRGVAIGPPATVGPLAVFACKALEAVCGRRAPAATMDTLRSDAEALPVGERGWRLSWVRDALGWNRRKRAVVSAALHLPPLGPDLARLVAAASLTHIGQSAAFGFGRYALERP